MIRSNTVNLVIGRRGSGKTTFILNKIKNTAFKKILIIDTLDHPHYHQYQIINPNILPAFKTGIKRILVNTKTFDTVIGLIKKHVKNCLIILEDAGKYITERIGDNMVELIYDTKQINVDMFILYHGLGDVVPKIFRNVDYITLFKINDHIATYAYKVPAINDFKTALEIVLKAKENWFNITFKVN